MEPTSQSSSTGDPRPTRYRWWVLALIFVIYVIAAADRANIGIVLPHLKTEFALSNTEAGAIISLFFLAYAGGQLPAAFLVKRFGVRRVLPTAMILTSVATALHGLVGSVLALKACRLMLGAAEAPIASACLTSINNWFPVREKGTAAGLFMAAAKFGPVIVPPLGAVIILSFGWQYIFFLFAIPGLILPWIWIRFVTDRAGDSRYVNEAEARLVDQRPAESAPARPARPQGFTERTWLDRVIRSQAVVPITTSRGAFLSWNIWGVSLAYFLFVGTMNVILAWVPTYLTEVKKFSLVGAGFVASAPFVGAVAGNMAGGWISDRLLGGRRKPLMLFSCVATVVMMYALRSAPNDPFALAALFGLTGLLLSLGFSLYGIFPSGLTDRSTFPIVTSILNTCGQLGGAAMPFLTGIILDEYSWDEVFLALAVSAFLALCLLVTIIEPRGVVAEPRLSPA